MIRASRRIGGFTFIEMTLVLIVAALALSISAVSLGKLYEARSVRGELRRIHFIIVSARDEAVFKHEAVALSIIDGGKTIVVAPDRGTGAESYALREGYVLRGDPVHFYPKGNSSGGVIGVTAPGGKEYEFSIEAVSGAARLKGL